MYVMVSWSPLLASDLHTRGRWTMALLSGRERVLVCIQVGKVTMRTGRVVAVRDTACQGEGPRHRGAEVAFIMAGWGREGAEAAPSTPGSG